MLCVLITQLHKALDIFYYFFAAQGPEHATKLTKIEYY